MVGDVFHDAPWCVLHDTGVLGDAPIRLAAFNEPEKVALAFARDNFELPFHIQPPHYVLGVAPRKARVCSNLADWCLTGSVAVFVPQYTKEYKFFRPGERIVINHVAPKRVCVFMSSACPRWSLVAHVALLAGTRPLYSPPKEPPRIC